MEAQQNPPPMTLTSGSPIGLVAPEFRNEEAERNLQSDNGIKVRSLHPKDVQRNTQYNVAQGAAPRRIRLQMNHQVGSNFGSLTEENAEVELPVIEEKDVKNQQTCAGDVAPYAVSTTDETAKDHDQDEQVSEESSFKVFSKAPPVFSKEEKRREKVISEMKRSDAAQVWQVDRGTHEFWCKEEKKREQVMSEIKRSDAAHDDLPLKEMIIPVAYAATEQAKQAKASAGDKQEKLCEISYANAAFATALLVITECEIFLMLVKNELQ